MDDYKSSLCIFVQDLPLLWDPTHTDYKNKDQRTQAWEQIDRRLKPPKKGVSAKLTWAQLNRSLSNALNRKKKRSGSGASADEKPWKFEKVMSFMVSVKRKRNTTGNVDSMGNGDDSDSSPESPFDEEETTSDQESQPIFKSPVEGAGVVCLEGIDKDNQEHNPSTPKMKNSNKKQRMQNRNDPQDGLMNALTRRLEEKKESQRFGFFKSIMPKVDALTDDNFLDFQVNVLNLLKNVALPTTTPPDWNSRSTTTTPPDWNSRSTTTTPPDWNSRSTTTTPPDWNSISTTTTPPDWNSISTTTTPLDWNSRSSTPESWQSCTSGTSDWNASGGDGGYVPSYYQM